jgi:hypothetical protein
MKLRGLYETLVTEDLEVELAHLDGALSTERRKLEEAVAPDRIALHVARVVERALDSLDGKTRIQVGLALAREIAECVVGATQRDTFRQERRAQSKDFLRAILGKRPDGSPESVAAPLIPLLDTTLSTNAPGEPRVGHQLLTEISSADLPNSLPHSLAQAISTRSP